MAKNLLDFSLSPGNAHDAPEESKLLERICSDDSHPLLPAIQAEMPRAVA
ncbi:MAG: hypothetical protein LBR74_00635 [Eubacterium sp.]|nr:hypothetical protein [Eubacterium sp.]